LGGATRAELALARSAGIVALAAAAALLAGFAASARRYATGNFGPEAEAPPGVLSRAAAWLLAHAGRSGPEREALRLVVPTLARSGRHRRTIVIFTAGGMALACTGLISSRAATDPLPVGIVAALHMTSLALLIGLRSVFGMPLAARPFETLRAMGGDELSAPALVLRALVTIVVVPLALFAGLTVGVGYGVRAGAALLGAYALLATALAWLLSRSFGRAPFSPGALIVEVPGATLGAALLLFGIYVGVLPAVVSSHGLRLAPFLLPAGVAAILAALLHRGDADEVAGPDTRDVSMHLAE